MAEDEPRMTVVLYENEFLYYHELSVLHGVFELGMDSGNFAIMDYSPDNFRIKVCMF